jgi:hypothetical protein
MIGAADNAQKAPAYKFQFCEVNDVVECLYRAQYSAKRTPHFDFANEIESGSIKCAFF